MRLSIIFFSASIRLSLQLVAPSDNSESITQISKSRDQRITHQRKLLEVASSEAPAVAKSAQDLKRSLGALFLSLGPINSRYTRSRQNLNRKSLDEIQDKRVSNNAQMQENDDAQTGTESAPESAPASEKKVDKWERVSGVLAREWGLVQKGEGEIAEFLQDFLPTFLFFITIRILICEPRYIPSLSMYPTLDINDNVAVEKVSKWQQGGTYHPQRKDVIVFQPPQAFYDMTNGYGKEAFIKRVVAVEGDTVEVHDGTLFVNGEAQVEPFIAEQPTYTLEAKVVPPGMVFCLGDNRNQSFDSHYWGFLPLENIIGRAFFRYWPPNKIQSLTAASGLEAVSSTVASSMLFPPSL